MRQVFEARNSIQENVRQSEGLVDDRNFRTQFPRGLQYVDYGHHSRDQAQPVLQGERWTRQNLKAVNGTQTSYVTAVCLLTVQVIEGQRVRCWEFCKRKKVLESQWVDLKSSQVRWQRRLGRQSSYKEVGGSECSREEPVWDWGEFTLCQVLERIRESKHSVRSALDDAEDTQGEGRHGFEDSSQTN